MSDEITYLISGGLLKRIRAGLDYSDPNSLLEEVDNLLAGAGDHVSIQITRCNFHGSNSDGSAPFTYLDHDVLIKKLGGIKLDGWTCFGPTYEAPRKWWEFWK